MPWEQPAARRRDRDEWNQALLLPRKSRRDICAALLYTGRTQRILCIQQILRQPEHTALVKSLLTNPAVITRAELVQEVCRRLNLRDPKGDWRVGTTMKALRDLEAQGWWTLPPTTQRYSGKSNPTRLQRPVPSAIGVPDGVEEVRRHELIEVSSTEQSQLWNELMLREHPLHQCRLVGRQLRYSVGSEHGGLGGTGIRGRRIGRSPAHPAPGEDRRRPGRPPQRLVCASGRRQPP